MKLFDLKSMNRIKRVHRCLRQNVYIKEEFVNLFYLSKMADRKKNKTKQKRQDKSRLTLLCRVDSSTRSISSKKVVWLVFIVTMVYRNFCT